jgi:hypothetical protein
MSNVYLDALLPREDFDSIDKLPNSAQPKGSFTITVQPENAFTISDLREDKLFYSALRKPDFRRETSEWSSEKVCGLVKSLIYGELIPAVILWRSEIGYNFVIDGAHRISSLIAWINDDYGDGEITKKAFNGFIPEDQIKIANDTRKLIEKEIGSYSDYLLALRYPEKVQPNIVKNARKLGANAIQLQWVEGDTTDAERSFLKIHQ